MPGKSATTELINKYKNLCYRTLGKTGLSVSAFGFGGYRIDVSLKIHYEALSAALQSGINLIDTSSNYSDGGSELLIRDVLNDLIKEGMIKRDEIVIVSKGGYIQGKNFEEAAQREHEDKPFPEVVKCSPDLWHCIHPEFLEHQITESLKRLSLDKIDVYLLHNPEYFLTYSSIKDEAERNDEYYNRIKAAFEHLEEEVKKGRISFYGVSSNTFGSKENANNFTSLERLIQIAKEISSENHFAVVQAPFNLLELGIAEVKNQGSSKLTFLELADKENLGVLTNRPLNAIEKNKIIRFSDFPVTENRSDEEIKTLLDDLDEMEYQLRDYTFDKMNLNASEEQSLRDCLSLSKIIQENIERFDSPNSFRDIKGFYLIPRANYAIKTIGDHFKDDAPLIGRLNNYAVATNVILDSIYSRLAKTQNEKNKELHKLVNKNLDKKHHKLSLSAKTLIALNSQKSISSVLVGMRTNEYVEDVISASKNLEK